MSNSVPILIAEEVDLLFEAIANCVRRIVCDTTIVRARDLTSLQQASKRTEDFRLIVIDAALPGIWESPATPKLLQTLSQAPLALLANAERDDLHHLARKLGVKAYLPRSAPRPVIMAALGLAFCGHSYYLAGSEPPLDGSADGADFPADAARPITRRHRQVLELLSRGMTNAEIGAQLGIAESTVRLHLREAYRRLGVRNRTQAMREVMRLYPGN